MNATLASNPIITDELNPAEPRLIYRYGNWPFATDIRVGDLVLYKGVYGRTIKCKVTQLLDHDPSSMFWRRANTVELKVTAKTDSVYPTNHVIVTSPVWVLKRNGRIY